MDCPECEVPIYGPRCACGYVIPRAPKLPTTTRTGDLPLPEPERRPPNPQRIAELRKAASIESIEKKEWWTPDKVTTQTQVDFIVAQAHIHGVYSPAGRFLQQCMNANRITHDHRVGCGKPDPFRTAPAVERDPLPWENSDEEVNW